MNGGSTVSLYGSEHTVDDMTVVDTVMHLSKPIRTPPRLSPNTDYRLWVMKMCQCTFISGNKYATVLGAVDTGGGSTWVGTGHK